MEHCIDVHAADVQSPDTVFALLSHHRRRDAVEFLAERESSVDLHDLAVVVASGEPATVSGDRATPEEVAVTLHHIHLPALDDAGGVCYDAEARTVTPGRTAVLTPLLETVDESPG